MKLTTRYVYDEHNRLNYAICDTSKWGSGERYFRRVATGSGGGQRLEYQFAKDKLQYVPDPSGPWHKTVTAARWSR